MSFVFACIAPHGGIVFGDPPLAVETRAALEELGRRFDAARPDVSIVLTPHNVKVEGHFTVVHSARLKGEEYDEPATDLAGDPELADQVTQCCKEEGVPVLAVSFGTSAREHAVMPLDWGAEIPLVFMGARSEPQVPALLVGSAPDLPANLHVRAGRAIGRAAERSGKRVALIASADHSHTHAEGGPYHVDTAAAHDYDSRVIETLRENRLADLLALDGLDREALADSLRQMLMLHGALGDGWSCELLSYEAPTYFGMACASFAPSK